MENKEQKKFYEKTWFIIFMLIFLCPVGVFLIRKNRKFNKIINIIITIVAIPYTLFGMLFWYAIFFVDTTTATSTNDIAVEKTQEEINNAGKNEEIEETKEVVETAKNEETEKTKEVVETAVKESNDKLADKSSDMLNGRTKVEDKESAYNLVASVRLSSNSLSLLDYLTVCNIEYDVYEDDMSTLVIFKYKDKDVNVIIDGGEPSYYYDGKLLKYGDPMMEKLYIEIFGVQAQQEYYVGKKAHSTKTSVTKNNSVLIGLTIWPDISVEAILSSKTTQGFYDNGSIDTIGNLLSQHGYGKYNKDLCRVENQGNGQYYISIGFGDVFDGYEKFGFNTNKNEVYLTQYISTRGISTNEDGLYAAKKLGYY